MLVSTEPGGLGNRIKSWVSVRRLSSDPRLFWPRTPNMPADFRELFSNDVAIETVPSGADVYRSWRLAVLPQDERHLPRGFAVVGGGAHPFVRGLGALVWRLRGRPDHRYRYMVFPKQHSRRSTRRDARHIDLEYGRIPAPVRQAYVPLFAELRPVREVSARTDEWWAGLNDVSPIGIQVRTWRDSPRRYRKYHLPARARLLEMMRARDSDSQFLVVSDSDEFIDYLRSQFTPERILTFPRVTKREDSWQSTEGVREDLIDMLLLARCDELIASYLSTFSEAAWWFGGARAKVSVF